GEVSAPRDPSARVVHSLACPPKPWRLVRRSPGEGGRRKRRTAPRSGTCAIPDCEPRQGRKAAALSRSWHVPQALRAAVDSAARTFRTLEPSNLRCLIR